MGKVVSSMSGYLVPWSGGRLRFVDRRVEVEAVLGDGGVAVGGMITVLYGPKGCGKTSFFKVLHDVLSSTDDVGFNVVIVASEREAWRAEMLYAPRSLDYVVKEAMRFLGFEISSSGDVRGLVDAGKLVSTMVGYIAYTLGRGRRILIVLDEVRADSDVRLSELRGWLESFANKLLWDNDRYRVEKSGSIAVMVLTNDALIREIRRKVGSKVNWALMWNLPYDAMVELSKQLGLDLDPKLLWRLTGGNPRALINIKTMGLERWVEEEVVKALVGVVKEAGVPREKLWAEIEKAVDNIDEASFKITNLMLKYNVALDTAAATRWISEVPQEKWIGKYYAYQIPAYHHALKAMVARRSPQITSKDVVEEAHSS